jgi:hypothetical protein
MSTPSPDEHDNKAERLTRLFDAQKRLREAAADYAAALDKFDVSAESWTVACESAGRMARFPFLQNLRPRPSRPHEFEPAPLRLIEGDTE